MGMLWGYSMDKIRSSRLWWRSLIWGILYRGWDCSRKRMVETCWKPNSGINRLSTAWFRIQSSTRATVNSPQMAVFQYPCCLCASCCTPCRSLIPPVPKSPCPLKVDPKWFFFLHKGMFRSIWAQSFGWSRKITSPYWGFIPVCWLVILWRPQIGDLTPNRRVWSFNKSWQQDMTYWLHATVAPKKRWKKNNISKIPLEIVWNWSSSQSFLSGPWNSEVIHPHATFKIVWDLFGLLGEVVDGNPIFGISGNVVRWVFHEFHEFDGFVLIMTMWYCVKLMNDYVSEHVSPAVVAHVECAHWRMIFLLRDIFFIPLQLFNIPDTYVAGHKKTHDLTQRWLGAGPTSEIWYEEMMRNVQWPKEFWLQFSASLENHCLLSWLSWGRVLDVEG